MPSRPPGASDGMAMRRVVPFVSLIGSDSVPGCSISCVAILVPPDVTSRRGLASGLVPDSRDRPRRRACRGHAAAEFATAAQARPSRCGRRPIRTRGTPATSASGSPVQTSPHDAQQSWRGSTRYCPPPMRIALPPTSASATLARPRSRTRPTVWRETPIAVGGLFVAEALEVDEADRLELVDGQRELLEVAAGDPGRLEQGHAGHAAYGSFNRWARHRSPHWLLAYAHGRGAAARLQHGDVSPSAAG